MRFGDLGIDEESNRITPSGFTWAPLLSLLIVHEAAHDMYPGHQGCGQDSACDPDFEGAYGLSAWWAMTWLNATVESIHRQACYDLQGEAYSLGCMRIGDFGDWPICDLDFVDC